MRQYKMINFKS